MDLMSTAQLLGNIGEFAGAIAVVITLGYVAVQIRQSTRVAGAEAIQGLIESHRASIRVALQNPELNDLLGIGANDYQILNQSDKNRFAVYLIDFGMQAQAVMESFNRGLVQR